VSWGLSVLDNTIDVFVWIGNRPVMPRKLRVEYSGAIYHMMNRGDRRESIVLGDSDCQLFLERLAQICEKTNGQVHAYRDGQPLSSGPRANLAASLRWFLGTYSAGFNRRHWFSGRYQSLIVDVPLATISTWPLAWVDRADLTVAGSCEKICWRLKSADGIAYEKHNLAPDTWASGCRIGANGRWSIAPTRF
jgi:hypothetical protein